MIHGSMEMYFDNVSSFPLLALTLMACGRESIEDQNDTARIDGGATCTSAELVEVCIM